MARLEQKDYEALTLFDPNQFNRKALIVVVDMVNGFVKEGNMADPTILDIVGAQKQLFAMLPDSDHLYFVDAHDQDCKEFKTFPRHCVKDSDESKICDELEADSEQSYIVYKNSTNGFLAPDFIDQIDKWMSYDDFVIVGCCSDICVLQFTLTLQTYINQYDLMKQVNVVVDGIDTYHNPAGHDAKTYNKMSIDLMKQAGVNVMRMEGNK